jgi:hypothetical protein
MTGNARLDEVAVQVLGWPAEAMTTAKLAMVERLGPLPEPRADISASIVLAREAFLAGHKDTYLGLTRDEWDRAADEHR